MLTANSLLLFVPAAAWASADTRTITRLLITHPVWADLQPDPYQDSSLVQYSRIAVEASETPLFNYLSRSPPCMSCPSYGDPSTPPPWYREEDCIEHQLGLQG